MSTLGEERGERERKEKRKCERNRDFIIDFSSCFQTRG
jgi:hypothetical protein